MDNSTGRGPIPPDDGQVCYEGVLPPDDALRVAVVGARAATRYSREIAYAVAFTLARAGVWVVSGLARGVDVCAHRGAIAAEGRTMAVLGHGLDCVYPAEHAGLARAIASRHGALLSAYPRHARPRKHFFPERNRLMALVSHAVIVVQAAPRSGSLITARAAMERGREVFVVPGPLGDERFLGGHRLIQDGAKLVTGVRDVMEELLWHPVARRYVDENEQSGAARPDPGAGGDAVTALSEAIARGEIWEVAPQRYGTVANDSGHSMGLPNAFREPII